MAVSKEGAEISVEDGAVVERKPDGSAVAMTPDAALKTGEALIDAAADAEGRRRIEQETRRDQVA